MRTKVEINDDSGFKTRVTSIGALLTTPENKLAGGIFASNAGAPDPNYWATTLANGGTVAITDLEAIISTNTTVSGAASISSVANAVYIGGTTMYYRAQIGNDAPLASNVRTWGAGDLNNGCFFRINGTTFELVARKNTTDTVYSFAAWNGNLGLNWTFSTNVNTRSIVYEIIYSQTRVYWYIDGVLAHHIDFTSTPWTANINLKLYFSNINTTITTNVVMKSRVATINRFGEVQTTFRFANITTATTTVLKYSPGHLHLITINNQLVAGNSIAIYDNTAASGTLIGTLTGNNTSQLITLIYDVPFFNGLTIVTTGSPFDITVSYD